jgi:cyanuric acid amidohydrolase
MAWECAAHKFLMASPDDMSGLEAAFRQGILRAEDVIGIIAKTEGNGKVNDFSRPFAHRCFTELLARWTKRPVEEIDERVALVMSGGCEGIISPHATVFTRRRSDAAPVPGQKRLTLSVANTRALLPEEVGAMAQVELVAQAVREALAAADVDSIDDVHYVQVKCPLLTSERINDAKARGKKAGSGRSRGRWMRVSSATTTACTRCAARRPPASRCFAARCCCSGIRARASAATFAATR